TPRKGDDCQLPLTGVPRAKRAGLEETKVDSGQVTSDIDSKLTTARSDVTWPVSTSVDEGLASETSICSTGLPHQCTAQGGEVWHFLTTVNFRCLEPREQNKRGPRQRKFTVVKRCRQSDCTCIRSLRIAVVHGTTQRGLALVVSEAAET
ncbi:hypothetical protein TYRP_015688, partial [Tyrophagus putrescentiae]